MSNALSTTSKLGSGDRNMQLDLYMHLTFCGYAAASEIPGAIQPGSSKPPGHHFDCNLFLKHPFLV